MKLNNIHLLMSVAVFLLLLALGLFFFFEKQARLKPASDTVTTQIPNKVNSPTNQTSANLDAKTKDFRTHTESTASSKNDASVMHNHDDDGDFDFSKYITDPQQIEEIRELSNRSTQGLVLEELPNNTARVNLQRRFRTVNVAVMDEHGKVHIGEWAPPSED